MKRATVKLSEKDRNIIGAILRSALEEIVSPQAPAQNWRSYVDILSDENFGTGLAREIFESIRDIRQNGEPLDVLTLIASLSKKGAYSDGASSDASNPDKITGQELSAIYHTFSTLESVSSEVARQTEEKKRLQAGILADSLKKAVVTGDDDLFWNSLFRIKDIHAGTSDRDRTFNAIVDAALKKAADIETAGGVKWKTGYQELDDKIIGYMGSDVVTIFGHPAQGKTATAVNLIVRAVSSGAKVMLVTIEDSAERMALRYLSIKLGTSVYGLYSGSTGAAGWSAISAGLSSVYTDNLRIVDNAYSLPDIYRRVLAFKPDILFVDHIHIMQLPKAESKDQSVSALMTGFKHLSKEEDIPVVLLAQTRKSPTRSEHPTIDDLYYSKEIENVSSVAMSVCWPWKVDESKSEFDYSWRIQKARIGTTGQINLNIDKYSLGIYSPRSIPSHLIKRMATSSGASFGGSSGSV